MRYFKALWLGLGLSATISILFASFLPVYWNNFIGIPIFAILMVLANKIVVKETDAKQLTQKLLIIVVMRLLVALIVVAIASTRSYPIFVIFVTHFGTHFLIFTVFETWYLINYLKLRT